MLRPLQSLLVTGGAGFIGSAFVRMLMAKAEWSGRVLTLDLLTYAGLRKNLESVAGHARHRFVQGDVRDEALLEKLCRENDVDTIVHFAAETHVDRSIADPKIFLDTNVGGTLALLEVMRRRGGMHLHHISTDEVYGSLGATGKFREDSPYDPRSPYAASKAAADHMVRAYANTYDLSTTVSNTCNNFGPHQFPEKFLPLMIANALEGKALPVYGDGQQVRDWLYVEDHAEALWTILQKSPSGESYNIGAGWEWKNLDLLHGLLEEIARLEGKDLRSLRALIHFVRDRPGHDRRYALDASKIQRELGWKPSRDFQSALCNTLRWYLEHPHWLEAAQGGKGHQAWLRRHYGTGE